EEILHHHQPVAWVLAENTEAARLGADRVRAEYRPLEAILTIDDAIAHASYHSGPFVIEREDAAAAIADSPHRLEGELRIGGHQPFYPRTPASIAGAHAASRPPLPFPHPHPPPTARPCSPTPAPPRLSVHR